MTDVFISYKKEDRARVRPIVEGLRGAGINVWWDQDIAAGAPWDETISAHLDNARCVVVVWSKLSVEAPWVKEEAGLGKARGVLAPVRIDDVDPPLGFGLIQMANLARWNGGVTDENWAQFVEVVRKILRGEKVSQLDAPLRRRRSRGWLVALGVLGVGAVAAAALFVAMQRPPSEANAKLNEDVSAALEEVRTASVAANAPPSAEEQSAWQQALSAKTRTQYQAYLDAFPDGRFAPDARAGMASCHTIEEVTYEPFEARDQVPGGGMAGSRDEAVETALNNRLRHAEALCERLGREAGAEDVRTSTRSWSTGTNCRSAGAGQISCTAPASVTCTGRIPHTLSREVCS